MLKEKMAVQKLWMRNEQAINYCAQNEHKPSFVHSIEIFYSAIRNPYTAFSQALSTTITGKLTDMFTDLYTLSTPLIITTHINK